MPGVPDPRPRPVPAAAAYPTYLLDWRPQQARRPHVLPTIVDPIVEPSWDGLQVLAHFDLELGEPDDPWLRMIDEDGDDLVVGYEEVAAELRRAILAVDAVIDGWLTTQATRSGEGALVTPVFKPSAVSLLTGRPGTLMPAQLPPRTEGAVTAFVAVDLLRVDGQDLLAVPLLERKRLLEGVLRQSALVRISPFTRPPLSQWLATWKASGFSGAVLKAANGSYEPGGVARDWAYVAAPEGRQR
jgi:ATP dependent DNA ligase domain